MNIQNKENFLRLHKQATALIGQGGDCGCEYQHRYCSTMALRRGFSMMKKLEYLIEYDEDIPDKIETPYDKYCRDNDL